MQLVLETNDPKFEDLIELIRNEWPSEYGEADDKKMVESIRQSYRGDKDVIKYLLVDDRIIGWYRFTDFSNEEYENTAHTLDISVSEGHKGKGYGLILMEDMILEAKRRNFCQLLSHTFDNNEISINLHRKAGFEEAFRVKKSIVWKYVFKE